MPEFLGRGSDSQPAAPAADPPEGGAAAVDRGLLDSLVTPSASERITP
jgi:hypothetical protein